MALIPVVVAFFIEGCTSISNATRELITKKFNYLDMK